MYVTEIWPTADFHNRWGTILPYELCKQSDQALRNQNPYPIKHCISKSVSNMTHFFIHYEFR
jgi:hypothetical protein